MVENDSTARPCNDVHVAQMPQYVLLTIEGSYYNCRLHSVLQYKKISCRHYLFEVELGVPRGGYAAFQHGLAHERSIHKTAFFFRKSFFGGAYQSLKSVGLCAAGNSCTTFNLTAWSRAVHHLGPHCRFFSGSTVSNGYTQ